MGMYDVTKDSFVISKEMDERAYYVMNDTWQTIGFDCLDLDPNFDLESFEEVILDANHLETYGQDDEAAKYCVFLARFHSKHFGKLCKKVY